MDDIMDINGRLSPILGELNVDHDMKGKDDGDLPAKEKIYRRRSSFLSERRKSFADAGIEVDNCNEHPHKNENEQLAEYITLLNQEGEQWNHDLNKAKKEHSETYKMFKEFCQKRTVRTEEECLAYLDEKEREYFNGLPDFEALMRFSSQAIKSNYLFKCQRRKNKALMVKLVKKDPNFITISKKKIIDNFKKMPV